MGIETYVYVIAVLQGLTEFLPISSTGHEVLGWEAMKALGFLVPSQDSDRILIEIAVHVGTLLAVMLYFSRDVGHLCIGAWKLIRFKNDPRGHLFAQIAAASVPLAPAGFIAATFIAENRYNLEILAVTSIVFGVLLWVADRYSWSIRKIKHMGLGSAFVIGLFQCLSLIPGVSRSGITITAGRFLALERDEAVRFTMLLSIPAILGAATRGVLDIARDPVIIDTMGFPMVFAGGLAFIVALPTIPVLMWLARLSSFTPFVIYRIVFGLVLIVLIATGVLPSSS